MADATLDCRNTHARANWGDCESDLGGKRLQGEHGLEDFGFQPGLIEESVDGVVCSAAS